MEITNLSNLFLFLIFATQILSIILIAEKCVTLFYKRTINQKELSKVIGKEIKDNNIQNALHQAKNMNPNNPLGSVAVSGIKSFLSNGSKEDIQLKIDEVLIKESNSLKKRIGYIALCANVATFIGLLGTVVSLINSFSNIDQEKILSQQISFAINITAYGLLVAIPALIMYAVLKNRASRLSDDLNKASLNIFIQLGYHMGPKNNPPSGNEESKRLKLVKPFIY